MLLKRVFRKLGHVQKPFANVKCFSSIDNEEVENFNNYDKWWQDSPAIKPLHAYNKLRVQWIREFLIKDMEPTDQAGFFKSLKALDVGSGGGLLSESLGRLGCKTLGIDPSSTSIRVAKEHLWNDLELIGKVIYKKTTIEELIKRK